MYKFGILTHYRFRFFSFPPAQNPFIRIPYNLISKISHFDRRILKISTRQFSLTFSLCRNLIRSHAARRSTFYNYIFSLVPGKFLFLFLFPYYRRRMAPSRKPINLLNVVPRTSAKCGGARENARRAAGRNRDP